MSEPNVVEVKHSAIADPSTVGLASFGIGLFTLSFNVAGIIPPSSMAVIAPLAIGVSIIHFFAAANGFKKGELFTALVFGIYGMFWFSYGLLQILCTAKVFVLDAPGLLAYLIAFTIFTAYVLLSALGTNVAVILTLALLLLIFVLFDLGLAPILSGGAPKGNLITLAGYVGFVDALCALYISAGGLLAAMYGRAVLPVGPVQARKAA